MRRDWDRRARVNPRYWVSATQEADAASYEASADRDTAHLLEGFDDRLPSSAEVLDLGCGMGRIASRLTDRFARVVGVDVSGEMIAAGQQTYGHLPNLELRTSSGTDLAELADGSFDFVFSYSVLPHLPQAVVEAYFGEVNRVLRPGGWFRYQFWVSEPSQPSADASEARVAANDTLSIRVYPADLFVQMNRSAGLEIIERAQLDYFDPVLKLHPEWITTRRVRRAAPVPTSATDCLVEVSAGERDLEYGLLLYLAIKHGERGEVEDAERVLETCIRREPERPEAYVEWATHRLEAEDVVTARRIFDELTTRIPSCAIGWLYLAQTALLQQDLETTRASLARIDTLPDVDPATLDQAREIRGRLGRPPPRSSRSQRRAGRRRS